MFQYSVKRLLLIIPTLFGITFITFLVMKLSPGDPIKMKLRFAANELSPDAVAAILQSAEPAIKLPQFYENLAHRVSNFFHERKYFDDPHYRDDLAYRALAGLGENTVFYLKWVKNIALLDFGRSSKDRRPVSEKIWEALPITLAINVLTIAIIYTVSIPLGIWSALRKGATIDKIIMVKLFIFYSLPSFWVATLTLTFFAGGDYLDLFPILGFQSDDFERLSFFAKLVDMAWHLVLPVAVSTIGGFAFLARFSRSNFLEVISQDYIRTARAKGLSEMRVLFKHGLRNALIPFVTLMGTLLPALLGGSVIIEQIFSIPGMGMLSFEAVLQRDHNTIMGIATIGAFLTLLSLLITDLLYVVVDPRIRLR